MMYVLYTSIEHASKGPSGIFPYKPYSSFPLPRVFTFFAYFSVDSSISQYERDKQTCAIFCTKKIIFYSKTLVLPWQGIIARSSFSPFSFNVLHLRLWRGKFAEKRRSLSCLDFLTYRRVSRRIAPDRPIERGVPDRWRRVRWCRESGYRTGESLRSKMSTNCKIAESLLFRPIQGLLWSRSLGLAHFQCTEMNHTIE